MRHTFIGIFHLGVVVATPGVLAVTSEEERISALTRHINGDWGNLYPEDWETNNWALENGDRILSCYRCQTGEKFWIITEADRSATTFLLPEEY
ncbi:hypothetical protein J6TS7_29500 [Paenibacillus dendritiformis]|uniref:hypothetical protein n=1 Tax=Paenibacillus TaxID=44249 RepID=UPI001B298BCD|nr:hypothetical protein [Paenibacillus dendritiformis]GIO79340.1 hypothetical protein J6TS7_29500 [Paenibacillus dendritiformis]